MALRAQSALRMWAGYETDVLKEFPARFERLLDAEDKHSLFSK